MRLWSLHPEFLDSRGLVALWRESLLAQAVLRGQTRGYLHHPQLNRFRNTSSPVKTIAFYLREVFAEAKSREYRFDVGKIGRSGSIEKIPVSRGQLDFEWEHLRGKLQVRAPDWWAEISRLSPRPHPLFRIVPGRIADWESTSTEMP